MTDRAVFTYQTRIKIDAPSGAALDAYADLFGKAERSLFSAIQANKAPIADLKRTFTRKFGLTARQFNAMRVSVEGKIASIKELRSQLIFELETKIAKAKRIIVKFEKQANDSQKQPKDQSTQSKLWEKLHHKKRRLHILETKLAARKADRDDDVVRLCFGSKKLFRAQFALEANGYKDIAEWKRDWRARRSQQFFVLGSQDETGGNVSCPAIINADGWFSLKLRLPDALAAHGKFISVEGIGFAYGHGALTAALQSSSLVKAKTKDGKSIVKRVGSAISYRFLRDEKGWRVFASIEAAPVKIVSRREMGAIGVDTNTDHLAVSEIDRFGNLVKAWRIDLPTYGKSEDQAKALTGDVCVAIAAYAAKVGKPVVFEKLDFQKKKAELESVAPKQARMLSSFACNKVLSGLKAACFRAGVETIAVNPAFTSVIGAVNYAQVKGISVHQGAAMAIARRGLGFSEKAAVRQAFAPRRDGGHVAFALPARNRAKHVWSHWARILRSLKAAHVAHFRSGASNDPPAPLRQFFPVSSPTWNFTARFRDANRRQNCLADVLDDAIPY